MPTRYTRDFTVETWPPRGIYVKYLNKGAGYYPSFGCDVNGCYMDDTSTTYAVGVVFQPVFPHVEQGYTASVVFNPQLASVTLDYSFGVAFGGTESTIVFVEYSNGASALRIVEKDIPGGVSTVLASVTVTAISLNQDYTFEVDVTYDSASVVVTVTATLKDSTGSIVGTITGSYSGYPLFGMTMGSGAGQSGRIY
ncbi:MAG: hypothetical protein GXO68_05800, partial [Crenarchaeota archaeon]|nr:hypothetical protein [Thermoproteota archaeon]